MYLQNNSYVSYSKDAVRQALHSHTHTHTLSLSHAGHSNTLALSTQTINE